MTELTPIAKVYIEQNDSTESWLPESILTLLGTRYDDRTASALKILELALAVGCNRSVSFKQAHNSGGMRPGFISVSFRSWKTALRI